MLYLMGAYELLLAMIQPVRPDVSPCFHLYAMLTSIDHKDMKVPSIFSSNSRANFPNYQTIALNHSKSAS